MSNGSVHEPTAPCPLQADAPRSGEAPAEFALTAGVVLIEQGQPAQTIWHLHSGSVVTSWSDDSGRQTCASIRTAPALVGFEPTLGSPATGEVRTLEPVVGCTLRLEDFLETLRSPEEPLQTLIQGLMAEVTSLHRERLSLHGSAVARLCRYLAAQERDTGPVLSRSMLASVLCMRPETLSRAIASLRSAGLVVSHANGGLEVLDPSAVAERAGRG